MTARLFPVWAFAVRKSREVARLTAEARELRLDKAILTARLRLAIEQRDRARDLVGALVGDSRWSEGDEAWMADNGVEPA